MNLIVDGYNVIPAIPELGRLLRQNLEEGREAFLKLVEIYRRSAGLSAVTVVFDGKGNTGGAVTTRLGGIQVLFSRNETADDLILRLLSGEKRGAVLVTSDRALGEAAAPFAGAVIRSGEFSGKLLQARHMEEGSADEEEEASPRRTTTKKRGNPRRLTKKERLRRKSLKKL